MKNALVIHLLGDLGVAYGSQRVIFYSIESSNTVIPAEVVRKVEQPKEGGTILYLNPHCDGKVEDGKLVIRYDVVGAHNSLGEEKYPDGYEFSIPLSIINGTPKRV